MEQLTATRDELVDAARALAPVVRERGPRADAERKLPEETVEDFKRLGIVRSVQPKRFGGMQHDVEVLHDLSMEVARGDGASGWLASFMGIHQLMAGWFSLEAQEEYWANGIHTLSSTVAGMSMAREEIDGGIRLSGRGRFSSGIDYAEWLILTTNFETCLIPRSDFEIIDDWHVHGLQGTGSKGLMIEDAFVPRHRIVTHEQMVQGSYPGAALHDAPWYRVRSPWAVLGHAILAPVIGMAQGVLDIFDERARERIDPMALEPAVERPGPQLRFAEASAEVEAARLLMRQNLAVVRASGETRQPLPIEARAEIRRNIVYAAKLAIQATNRLVDGMDSSALYQNNFLHRQARDVRAGALQFVLHWEETAIQYSRVHWGLEPNTPLI